MTQNNTHWPGRQSLKKSPNQRNKKKNKFEKWEQYNKPQRQQTLSITTFTF